MNSNLAELKRAMENAEIKVISFDIFDTLIVRLTAKAEDIFTLMQHKTGIEHFRQTRIDMQTKRSIMAEKTQNKPHCSFDEIYEYMQQNADLDLKGYNWQQIKQMELDIEKQMLVCNTPVFELYKYALEIGKRVIVTSDMYLGANEILPLLKNCGYDKFDGVYISADVNKTKYRLDIFDYVVQNEGVSANEILHIGDNIKDDVENARKCGLNAEHYNGSRYKEDLSLYRSVAAGVSCYLKNCNDSFWYNVGASVGGALYCEILSKVKDKIENLKPDKIFYLARDGYNLYKIAQETGIIGNEIKGEYLYASRRSMLLCGIDKLDDTAKEILPPFTFGQTVKEILDYLDLGDVKEESVKQCGFKGFNDKIENKGDFNKFRRILETEDNLFFEKANSERKYFENYLNKIGFLDCNALVFDCGWNGSSQYLLDRALDLMDYKGKNSFIYTGLMNTEKCRKQLSGKKYDTILFGINSNNDLCSRLNRSIVLLELFFGAPHGSVWKYDEKGFIEETIEKDFEYKNEILNGIIDFVKIAYPLYKSFDITPTSQDCLAQVFRLIENPTVEEATKIGDLENVDGFASKKEQKKYIAKLTEQDIKDDPNELYWPQGIYVRTDIPQQVKDYVMKKTGVKMADEKNKIQDGSKQHQPNILKRVLKYVRDYGVITTAHLIKNRFKAKDSFDIFIKNTENDILKTTHLEYKPLLSFVIPVYNVVEEQLRECIDSVLAQTYDNYEIILVDDKSTWEFVPQILKEYEDNPKITVIYRSENGHISRCTNTGIEAAKGEYIVFMDCDDTVSPNAVYEITKILNEDKTLDFIYSDEDKLTEDGKVRHFHHFKPDWSPDTFMSHMYTNHLAAYRRSIVNEIGGLRVGYEGSQDYDFTLRFTEKTNKVGHIPKILYHWRERPESVAVDINSKPYVLEVVKKLKIEALKRRGIEGDVIFVPQTNQFRVTYKPKGDPLVSIIIPSKDNFELIQGCISSIDKKTDYKNYEIVVVDNGSNDENKKKYADLCKKVNAVYHYEKMQFNFAKMCNIGANIAKGEYLLFLNDDTEVIESCWLGSMLGQACLEHTGAVGAKLLYENGVSIQHCGVINLPVIGPCHSFCSMDDNIIHYFCRNKLDYNYLAVTAACLCVSKEKFNSVDGFDENLAVAYNDMDLCFKLYEKGWYNVVRNDAVLYHYESMSRGIDNADLEKNKRRIKELDVLYSKHPDLKGKDPFYNINLTQNKVDCSLNLGEYDIDNKCISNNKNIAGLFNESVKLCIDAINCTNLLEVSGWAFIESSPLNNLNKKYIILVDEDNIAVGIYETDVLIRTDVTSAFSGQGNLNLSGFKCSAKISDLPKGKYKVGIMISNPLTFKKGAAVSDKIAEVL